MTMRSQALSTPSIHSTRVEATDSSNATRGLLAIKNVTQDIKSTKVADTHRSSSFSRKKEKPTTRIRLTRSNSAPAYTAVTSTKVEPPKVKLSSLDKDDSSTPERRVIANDIRTIQRALASELAKSPERYQKASDVLNTELEPALEKYDGRNGHLSYQDTKQAHVAFKKLSKQLPKGDLKELCTILAQHTKCDWMQIKHEKLQAKQLEEYLALGKPGAGKATTYNMGINGGASLLAVPGTEAKVGPFADLSLGLSTETRFNADDEGLVFEEISHGLSAGLKGGIQANLSQKVGLNAQANASGQGYLTYFKEWNNSKDYVAQNGPEAKKTKALKKQKQLAANSQHRLNDLLKSALKINASVNAPAPERTKPLTGFYTTKAGDVGLSVNAGTSFNVGAMDINFGGGFGVNRAKSTTDIYEFVPNQLADVVLKNKEKLNELPDNFTHHARQILTSNKDNDPKAAIGGLNLLKRDVSEYYDVVQKYDYFKSSGSAKKSELRALKSQKHAIENRWGAIGRHQFLQFASASHALFASTIMPNKHLVSGINTKREQELSNLIGQTGVLVQNPSIDYSKSRLDKIATFEQEIYLQVADTRSRFEISVGPFKGQLDIVERQRIHPSRIREGRYIDVVLTGALASSVQGLVNGATIKEALAQQGVELPGELDIAPDIGGGISFSHTTRFFKPEYSKADDYQGEKGWRKQLSRNTKTLSANVNLGVSGTVATGVHAGANIGINKTKTTVMSEKIAHDDLTFTMVRFNRFFRDANLNTNNAAWEQFFTDNKADYKKMFALLGSGQHPMIEEVKFFYKELIDRAPHAEKHNLENQAQAFFATMADFRADEDNEIKFNEARVCLEDYLEKLTVPWWEAHTGRWKDLEFKSGANSGLDLKSKLLKGLGVHLRANKFQPH
ncbi:hypothetical protein GCM10007938_13550 [Vibrio zhanjiangensis]|uniref:Uncharacterized protein n=1 Tax=Vibrio zhanjiangensis TaxID=1046128 RepID=A0ABQ6EYL3_9VIBR|nr:hypothetical protein [Vibrio zhanjiangensis]GLT17577.1 hypothetical protein GCM10007938_13550 [Vibrio zhanjiangensis]